jgi:hypothetical protein
LRLESGYPGRGLLAHHDIDFSGHALPHRAEVEIATGNA